MLIFKYDIQKMLYLNITFPTRKVQYLNMIASSNKKNQYLNMTPLLNIIVHILILNFLLAQKN
jgi:hypothetical protein